MPSLSGRAIGAKYTSSRKHASLLTRYADLFRVSFREVIRKRRRYIGVVAAIALGTAGFIIIVTMGRDLKANFNNDLDLLGGVTVVNPVFEATGSGLERVQWFREETMIALRALPGVRSACRTAAKYNAQLTWHDVLYSATLIGVEPSYWNVFNFTAHKGRLFGEEESSGRRKVCVVGAELAKIMFDSDELSLGQMLTIDGNSYEVVGILGGVRAQDSGLSVIIPLPTAMARIEGLPPPTSCYVRCETWDDVVPVVTQIPEVVKTNQPAQGLLIRFSLEALEHVKRVYWWVTLFIYASIGATLILGGVGIWNIMMAAVVSRTKEIGLKKAMGAEDGDIFIQFLFEAMCVTLGAALIGVALGRAGIDLMSSMLNIRPPDGLFWLCLGLGMFFAFVLGLGSGLYPSIRASRMEVVEAMRYE